MVFHFHNIEVCDEGPCRCPVGFVSVLLPATASSKTNGDDHGWMLMDRQIETIGKHDSFSLTGLSHTMEVQRPKQTECQKLTSHRRTKVYFGRESILDWISKPLFCADTSVCSELQVGISSFCVLFSSVAPMSCTFSQKFKQRCDTV